MSSSHAPGARFRPVLSVRHQRNMFGPVEERTDDRLVSADLRMGLRDGLSGWRLCVCICVCARVCVCVRA